MTSAFDPKRTSPWATHCVTGHVCTGRLRDPSLRNHVRAVTLIAVEGKGVEKVMRRMQGFPEVRRLHSTKGRWDIVAELVTDTLEAFDGLLNRIREIDGITATETSILLSSSKDLV